MKNKVLNKVVAILLIIALTIADFVVLGANLVSYALENINDSTSNENVKFAAYFKNEKGEVSQTKYEITSNEMKLYLEVGVQNEGYFDGVVTLENSNFKLKQNGINKEFGTIDGNKITLNRVRAGNTVKIELEIEPIIDESYKVSMLNQESVLKLAGNYINSSKKNIQIEAEKKVQLALLSPTNLETNLNGKVITNRVYKIGENNQRLIQIQLNSVVEKNAYPVKATTFELALPEGVKGLEVISKGTYATNGEADRKLEENSNYTWDKVNKKLQVKIENSTKDGKISWKKDGIDNIIVTLILDEEQKLEEKEYNVKSKVEFYGQDSKVIEKDAKWSLEEEADGIIRTSIENKEIMYKGKIYSREERPYNSTTNIEVNYANLIENAIIKEKTVYRIDENSEDKSSNVQYVTTTISKAEFEKILGKEGSLTIKDQNGNLVKEVKASDFAESENITITYAEGVKELTLEITKTVNTGIIRLNHEKVIKTETYTNSEIENIKLLVEQVEINYGKVIYEFEMKKKLNDTVSEVGLTVKPQTISVESKDVEIAITLKTDNEKYELFENPTFTLTLPEGVTINSLSDGSQSSLYGGLSISKLEAINNRQIIIEIEGKQQEYIKSNINTQINFNANVSVQKFMSNKVDTIKMEYQNKGNTHSIESGKINVVASNAKIVTHLEVQNYNGQGAKLEKYSDSKTEVNGELLLENNSIIEVPIKYTIINNHDSEITLVANILANYINKENKETNLINYSNSEVKISARGIKTIEQVLKIPAGLYFSEKINIETLAEYTQFGTSVKVNNSINLETESKEGLRNISVIDNKIKVETFTQFGDGTGIKENDSVYNEQIITYIIEVTNISNETISNINVKNKQDNGNIYDLEEVVVVSGSEFKSDEEYIEHRYAELDTNIKEFETIKELKPGESKELVCKIVSKKNNENDITSANISISLDRIKEQNINKISNRVKDSSLKISTEKAYNEEVQIHSATYMAVIANIKNLTNAEMKDLNVRLYLSDGLIFPEEYNLDAFELVDKRHNKLDILKNTNYNKEENYIEFTIKNLKAGQEIIVEANLKVEEIPLMETSRKVKAYTEVNNIISNSAEVEVEQIETEFSVVQTVNVGENRKVKDGEKIIIIGEIINKGNIDTRIIIRDRLQVGLEVTEAEFIRNGETIDVTPEKTGISKQDNVNIITEINPKEKIVVKIEANVNMSRIELREIKNIIYVEAITGEQTFSNEINIQLDSDIDNSTGMEEPEEEPEIEIPENKDPVYENPEEPDNPEEPGKPENPEEPEDPTYTISGIVWMDKNENGNKENDETIKDVIVKIIDLNNKNIFLKDKNGNEIEVKTDKNGKYEIKEIPKGNYNLIFKYDTSIYELKENTKVKDYIIENTNEKVAITNNINLEGDKSIDLELMELTEFDLKMDKYISKVIVQTANGTKTSTYSKQQLAKEEILKKYLSGATVLVEYTMEISNVGELGGYATQIVDYIPKDMKFYSELNTQWYVGEDGNLYNTTLANLLINPGETKTIKLILSKTMTKDNTGTTTNIAEISDLINPKEYADIDLTNNQSKAEIIINTATGTVVTYIIAVLNAIVILLVGIYIIKKKVIGKE